jgi:hypothetical protein
VATTLYPTSTASDLGGAGQKALSASRGLASTSAVTNTTASGTNIQVTDTAGGQVLTWFSVQVQAVTISGTVTVNVRGKESANTANAGAGILIERCDALGNVISAILNDVTVPSTITEYSTSDAAKNGTYTPTSTALADGDRIKMTLKVRNAGTMGGSQTVTNTYSGPTAAAAGDTFVTFTETILSLVTATGHITPAIAGLLVTPPRQVPTLL